MNEGWIFQINTSDGGVPKLAVREADVDEEGVAGDRQAHLDVHGGPERALCLYSLNRILDLQSDGHPIFPGALGENLTIAGLDWERLVPGGRLRVGETLEIEITRYTTPCPAIAGAFRDGSFVRVSQDERPGWSRLYARVLTPGAIRVGDPVRPA